MFSLSLVKREEIEGPTVDDGRFKFDSFNILSVVKFGEPLLGSAGDEFDIEDDSSSSSQGIDIVMQVVFCLSTTSKNTYD